MSSGPLAGWPLEPIRVKKNGSVMQGSFARLLVEQGKLRLLAESSQRLAPRNVFLHRTYNSNHLKEAVSRLLCDAFCLPPRW